MTDCEVSVVIISKNEEERIGRCIESVIEAVNNLIVKSEIILVDSASTDKTIEIAKKYPVRILQSKYKCQFSPAAGRYIGSIYSKGEYIQFVDGDMVLDANWLKNALPVLKEDNLVAGLVGLLTQEPYDTYSAKKLDKWMRNLKSGEIDYFDGSNLIKKNILMEIGNYNPYLKGHEETELSLRITANGYKILRLPHKMAHHLGGNDKLYTFLRKKFLYNIGLGQIARYYLKNKVILNSFLREHKLLMFYISYYFSFLILILISLLAGNLILIYIWLAGLAVLFYLTSIKSRSLKKSANYMFSSLLRSISFVIGFLKPVKDIDKFPMDVLVIK